MRLGEQAAVAAGQRCHGTLALCSPPAPSDGLIRVHRTALHCAAGLLQLLFLQQAIKGSVEEFRPVPEGTPAVADGTLASSEGSASTWQLVNGLWSLLLAFGLLFTSLLLRQARSWRFLRAPLRWVALLRPPCLAASDSALRCPALLEGECPTDISLLPSLGLCRGVLADYGAALMLLAFSGLSFAVHGGGIGSGGGADVPRRVHSPNTWEVQASWRVAAVSPRSALPAPT